MALAAIVAESEFETLDESLKTFYVQNTDTKDYYLDVDGPDRLAVNLQTEKQKLAENNQKLVDQLAKERQKAESLAQQAKKALEKVDAKDGDDLIAKLADLEAKNASYEEALKAERDKQAELAAANARTTREAEIARVMREHKMMPSAAANLRESIEIVRDDDGNYKQRVIDPQTGQPMIQAGQGLTIEQLVAGWKSKAEYGNLFQAEGGGGMGTPGRINGAGPGSGKTMTRTEFAQLQQTSPKSIPEFFAQGGQIVDD